MRRIDLGIHQKTWENTSIPYDLVMVFKSAPRHNMRSFFSISFFRVESKSSLENAIWFYPVIGPRYWPNNRASTCALVLDLGRLEVGPRHTMSQRLQLWSSASATISPARSSPEEVLQPPPVRQIRRAGPRWLQSGARRSKDASALRPALRAGTPCGRDEGR